MQRYLDEARAYGLYLLLDLQPGRSDFVTEARRYEPFLREPDLGLALDPEWRMAPGQVPGDGVGQVGAAEVNSLLDYVAGLVAEARLPQKLVLVHQFQLRMVTERETLREPSELALMIHVDGFGTHAQKLDTYRVVRANRRSRTASSSSTTRTSTSSSRRRSPGPGPGPRLITYQVETLTSRRPEIDPTSQRPLRPSLRSSCAGAGGGPGPRLRGDRGAVVGDRPEHRRAPRSSTACTAP